MAHPGAGPAGRGRKGVIATQELIRILWEMHPIEHLTDFLSSLIIVGTAVGMIYPKTRRAIVRHLRDRARIQRIDADKAEMHDWMAKTDSRLDLAELSNVTLLHDRLYASCTRAVKRGWTTLTELDNIEHLYGVYHQLGGNGTGTELYKRVKQLPIKSESWEEN